MNRKIRVIQYGLGPVGCMITQYIMERGAFEIIDAIDKDSKKVEKMSENWRDCLNL